MGLTGWLRPPKIPIGLQKPSGKRICFDGSDILSNSDMRSAEVRNYCKSDETGDSLMWVVMQQLSARAHHRVLKLARTIADLAGEENNALVQDFAN